ncbi:peptide/nickel transport system substrate-binding protein [Paenibacillus phyllosphaerae]|uniref:Peptide/nickel transport system substrate-binding protein n=1 Tax=Paenibacillus phyllosphaerae TaxID=274593 RepID=A0A7W5AZ18_9BACL|nr:nickel ABC transporter substrate-binding protein [Paenibacillus phyllosphaerae]MBB3111379.1 peptide/nickel transport system substrate-binding protein [Paenibacillus phyllosphaerae]
MFTRSILSLVMLCSVLWLAACSSNVAERQPETKKSVNLLFNFATSSLDPNVDSSYVSLRAGITETLIHLNDESLTIEPWLAESWNSTDGQVWTIQLREGVTFHNGNPMDGAAVKASLQRAMQESVAIANALRIESIEADGNTLTIKTKAPFPEFPSELVHPNTSIIDVTETDYINRPIGTGPFTVSAFTPGTAVDLVRYDGYWNGPSKLETARFSFNEDANARTLALQSGAADIVFRPAVESLDSLKAVSGVTVDSTSTFRVHQITMNLERKPLQDIHVRKAIDALIDRQAIVDTILNGHAEAAAGPFPSSFSFAPDYPAKPSGLEAAKAYLQQAGYSEVNGVMQKNGEPLALTLLTYSSRADLPLIAQVLQSDAGKLGIGVTIEQIERPEEYMASNRDWDLATYSNLTAPRGDAGYYLNATFHPQGALNFSGVQDAALTMLIDKLNVAIGQQERSDIAEQVARYVDEQAYNSFVLHPNTLVAYQSEKIANWVTSRSEYYMLTNELDVK